MPVARASMPSSKAGRSCRRRNNSNDDRSPGRSSSNSNNNSSSSSGSRGGSRGGGRGAQGGSKKEGSKVRGNGRYSDSHSGVLTAPLPPSSRWPPRSSQPRPSRCLDALLRENVLLTVLPFLEAADATRFAACCTDLHTALTTPRVQPLWRRWFETSGFVWWPYGGACGSSCSLEIDKDGFILQQQERQGQRQGQQQLQLQLAGTEGRPGAGYRQFSHEGWCCQFLWNARSLHNWKSGTCAFAALHTDSHKLFMVSIHPKGVYASRAEATPLSPTAAPLLQRPVESPAAETPQQTSQHHRQHQQPEQQQEQQGDSPSAAPLRQQTLQSPTSETPRETGEHDQQHQQQQQQQQNSPTAAPLRQQAVQSPAAETPRQARQHNRQQQQQHQQQDSLTPASAQQQTVRSPAAETPRQTRQHSRQQQHQQQQQQDTPAAAALQQQALRSPAAETPRQIRQQRQQQQQQQQQHAQQQQQLSSSMDAASAFRLADAEPSSQPSVHFTPGAGRYLRAALHAKPAVLTAAADRIVCITEPLKKSAGAPSTSSPSKSEGVYGNSSCCCHRPSRGVPAVSVSPVSACAAAGSISSLASLELELESLVSGGSGGRRGSGKARKSGSSRQAGASAPSVAAAAGVGGSGDHRRASGDAAAAAAAAGEVREICRCWPRGAWLGCSVDAASGLMACSYLSTEAAGNSGRGRRKKGNSGSGAAEPCEYKVFDLLQETELAQLAIEGQLVHRLILNFIFSQSPSRVFGFDRWHREFFVWTISNVVPGEALETSAIVNAHTDGILGLDVTETYSSLKVLSGSRDETISLYSVDPLLRLATFTGHQAEVSAVCWLRNGEAAPSVQQFSGEQRAPGAYDGTIKIWDARQADPKSLSGNGLTLLEHQNKITRLATAWDGRMLLSGDSEGVVKLWDLRKCADSVMTAKYNGAILDLHANRAFCVVRSSPPRGRDTVHVLDFCGRPS